MRSHLSDLAIVLSRVDYAEKDRILTLLTVHHGKIRAIAKGVRSAKSKLAGGIELFAENELVLAEGRGELYTVTSSRMKHYYGNIAKNADSAMYAYECLKNINSLTPDGAGEEYYEILARLLAALERDEIPLNQIKIWYGLQVLANLGALPNLASDDKGKPLSSNDNFEYDFDKHCFFQSPNGAYGANHLKVLRYLHRLKQPQVIQGASEELTASSYRLINLLLNEQQR